MRKFTLSFCAVLFIGSILFAQVQPTNASLENWTLVGTAFSNPDDWQTTNLDLTPIGVFETTTEQTTGAQDGASFARLITTDAAGMYTLPGMLTFGIINIANQTLTGGVPYTDRPEYFRGYYNYNSTGDLCGIGCYFTKWNGTSADTVAIGSFYSDVSTTAWTMFDILIDYQLSIAPDTMNIVISSSGTTPVIGSVLDVDNLYFEGLVLGVNEINGSKELAIYPNPSKDIFNITISNIKSVEVIDITGKVVYYSSYKNNVNNVKINLSDKEVGVYMVKIKTDSKVITKKLLLN